MIQYTSVSVHVYVLYILHSFLNGVKCITCVFQNFVVSNEISPLAAPKGNYGTFTMQPVVSLFEKVTQQIKPVESDVPLTFENMGINSGFVMYETILTEDQKNFTTPVDLIIRTIRDQAYVYLDQVCTCILYYSRH